MSTALQPDLFEGLVEMRWFRYRAIGWRQKIRIPAGTCPCGREGRLWWLDRVLRCGECLQARELQIGRQAKQKRRGR